MILCVKHELFVNETNTITIDAYKDTNGDGKADQKRMCFKKMVTGRRMQTWSTNAVVWIGTSIIIFI